MPWEQERANLSEIGTFLPGSAVLVKIRRA
jgi:hypothetical protein